jgi:hypothetical protein
MGEKVLMGFRDLDYSLAHEDCCHQFSMETEMDESSLGCSSVLDLEKVNLVEKD